MPIIFVSILEGNVQKAGDRVRIAAQLVNATTGYHLWSENYDRDLSDIFALQDEITLKIISAIGAEVTSGGRTRLLAKVTTDVEAYIEVLQGFHISRSYP